jgi:uncharacterized protein (TIGR02466 family)
MKEEIKLNLYFNTPIYSTYIPEWVDDMNKICDKYIKDSKKNNLKIIKEQEKKFCKKIGDHGMSYHSESLIDLPKFEEIQKYIGETSWDILNNMGYDLSNYELFFTDFWVQEFAEKGGGHHEGHVHHDSHISGFYFLKCSDKTSFPVFHEPRLGKLITQLPLKNEKEITFGTEKVSYKPKPGTIIFFPSFLKHQYVVDNGIEPFRFIHFNLQAVRKIILNKIRNK